MLLYVKVPFRPGQRRGSSQAVGVVEPLPSTAPPLFWVTGDELSNSALKSFYQIWGTRRKRDFARRLGLAYGLHGWWAWVVRAFCARERSLSQSTVSTMSTVNNQAYRTRERSLRQLTINNVNDVNGQQWGFVVLIAEIAEKFRIGHLRVSDKICNFGTVG